MIAEGALGHDGALHVRALGFPPTEPRSGLPLAAQGLNLWGGARVTEEAVLALQREEAMRGAGGEQVRAGECTCSAARARAGRGGRWAWRRVARPRRQDASSSSAPHVHTCLVLCVALGMVVCCVFVCVCV